VVKERQLCKAIPPFWTLTEEEKTEVRRRRRRRGNIEEREQKGRYENETPILKKKGVREIDVLA